MQFVGTFYRNGSGIANYICFLVILIINVQVDEVGIFSNQNAILVIIVKLHLNS